MFGQVDIYRGIEIYCSPLVHILQSGDGNVGDGDGDGDDAEDSLTHEAVRALYVPTIADAIVAMARILLADLLNPLKKPSLAVKSITVIP